MIVYVLFMCIYKSGCMNYEFKDNLQCQNAIKVMKNSNISNTNTVHAYCQEVRK